MTQQVAQADGRRVLAYPFHDWRKVQSEGVRTRDAHILEALCRRPDVERVLVVNRPSSRAERWLRRGAARSVGEAVLQWDQGGAHAAVTRVGPKLEALDLAVGDLFRPILRRRGWWFDAFRQEVVATAIDRAAAARLGSPTEVIGWLPPIAPVMFRLGGRTIFDALDNWLIHPAFRANRLEAEAAYAVILSRADAVFASGPASARVLERWRAGVRVLPNGVDPEVFSGDRPRPVDLPLGPIVGYAGKLAQRIDDELVASVADALPHVSFVFIGPTLEHGAVRRMRARRNVMLLGDRPYEELPAYLRAFDLAWIPHRVGEGETGGDPIKLYEYWAAGRQVISTRIDGSQGWAAQVHLVGGALNAAERIRGLLGGSIAPLPTTVPRARTWDAIAAALLGD